jgi:quercetin dioxygenase-like cupin family protein
MEVIPRNPAARTEILPGVFKTPKVKTDALEVLELELTPGAALDPHDMPCFVTFFALEGTGTFTYGDTIVTVPAGDMVRANTGTVRFWANRSEATLRLLVIKSLGER